MARRHRVLRDRRLDHRLRRDGFAAFPLIDPAVAADLRATYLELAPPGGEGFVADLNLEDRSYREQADAAIAAALDGPATAAFVDHRPFLHAFLCKHPGADSYLYIHRDWMYVDERVHDGTYVVWVALQDITGDNGQLRVLRGSHTIDRALRGTDLNPPWTRHQATMEERMLSVPVRAGECLVFHNALVHCSYPNHTDEPRVVAAVGMRPAAAPLVHFRRADEHTALRYDIDERFFFEHSPGGLLAAPPDLEPVERIDLVEPDLSESELAARLDRGLLAKLDRRRRQRASASSSPASSS